MNPYGPNWQAGPPGHLTGDHPFGCRGRLPGR